MSVPVSSNEGLHGQVAIVTGGSGSIGGAIVASLAARGATVYSLDTAPPRDAQKATFIEADVTSSSGLQQCVDGVLAVAARLDIAVGAAGVASGADLLELEPDDVARVLDVNLMGFLYLMRAVIPQMQREGRGKIVALGSVASRVGGVKSGPHYVAAKAGVSGAVKWAAKKYGPDGIHVNCVAPGPVLTPMWQGLNSGALVEEADGYPLGRLGRAEDVAEPVAFLCGPESNWITGLTLDINGGSYMS